MGCLRLKYEDYKEERPSLSVGYKNPILGDGGLSAENFAKKRGLYTDHLGNGRVWLKYNELTEQPEVIQQADYYPFGLQHDGKQNVQSGVTNNYTFNGSVTGGKASKKSANLGMEFVEDLGLNVHHSYYRAYDPAIGRFWQIDPLAEVTYSMSPYVGFNNNPILFMDPNGDIGDPVRRLTRKLKRAGFQFSKDGAPNGPHMGAALIMLAKAENDGRTASSGEGNAKKSDPTSATTGNKFNDEAQIRTPKDKSIDEVQLTPEFDDGQAEVKNIDETAEQVENIVGVMNSPENEDVQVGLTGNTVAEHSGVAADDALLDSRIMDLTLNRAAAIGAQMVASGLNNNRISIAGSLPGSLPVARTVTATFTPALRIPAQFKVNTVPNTRRANRLARKRL